MTVRLLGVWGTVALFSRVGQALKRHQEPTMTFYSYFAICRHQGQREGVD